MFKIKHFPILILPVFLASFITVKAFARPLTDSERKQYGQNNIIFVQPCDTEEDCKKTGSDIDPGSQDGGTPGDSGGTYNGHKGNPFTPSGEGVELIVSTARAMAWPTDAGTCRDSSGNYVNWVPNYMNKNAPCQNTMSDYLKSIGVNGLIRDCGKFVGLVMRKTVDPNFQASGVKWQIPYMLKSPKWEQVSTDGQKFSMANLKPGDVIAFSENGHGHIMIWLGDQTVPCSRGRCSINVASSSFGTRSPSLNRISKMQQCTASRECFLYKVFRWQGEAKK
jgi:hypothetical protein